MKHDKHGNHVQFGMVGTRTPQGMAERLHSRMERPRMRLSEIYHRQPVQGDHRMKHNPFGILFAVTLTVCLCVAPIIIFAIS